MRILAPALLFIVGFAAGADDSSPAWLSVTLPGIEADTYILNPATRHEDGDFVTFVFLGHGEPKAMKYLGGEEMRSEVQEWQFNCETLTGGVPTIRYSNLSGPYGWDWETLIHPRGKEPLTPEQVSAICEQAT